MWPKAVLLIIAVPALVMVAATLYGRSRWESATNDLRQQLEAAQVSVRPQVFHSRELAALPAPVQRYFRMVLGEGQPMIAAANVEHIGTFNMGEAAANWKSFTSTQRVVTRRPGFVWDGRVAIIPGLSVHVHDAYVGGVGILHPAILGLVSLADIRGTRDMAEGELMRFLAEAAWYPTALLPSQGVHWEGVDDRSASATLTDGAITVTMLFIFSNAGLIDAVRANARGRLVAGKAVPTPWEGRWSNYELRDGMQVPMQGEVAWRLPGGPNAYWRGTISRLQYELAK